MVAYSFQKRFVGQVLAGLEPGPWLPGMKRNTLRRPRTGRTPHARPEQPVLLCTGMRTKHYRQIGRAVCRLQMPVLLTVKAGALTVSHDFGASPRSSFSDLAPIVQRLAYGERLHKPADIDEFARADGFADVPEMTAYFEAPLSMQAHNLRLILIAWSPEVAE